VVLEVAPVAGDDEDGQLVEVLGLPLPGGDLPLLLGLVAGLPALDRI
jgi:hypothetical protein